MFHRVFWIETEGLNVCLGDWQNLRKSLYFLRGEKFLQKPPKSSSIRLSTQYSFYSKRFLLEKMVYSFRAVKIGWMVN